MRGIMWLLEFERHANLFKIAAWTGSGLNYLDTSRGRKRCGFGPRGFEVLVATRALVKVWSLEHEHPEEGAE
jgi:hypothetical protein